MQRKKIGKKLKAFIGRPLRLKETQMF